MRNVETSGGARPEYEVSKDAVFARQDVKAQEIMESTGSFESKIEELAAMQKNWRELEDLVRMEQGH